MPDEFASGVKELMKSLLDSEYDWAESVWEDYKDDYGVSNGAEFFALLYGSEDYDAKDKDRDTTINEIAENYGSVVSFRHSGFVRYMISASRSENSPI